MWIAITGPVGIAVAILAGVVAAIVAITLATNAAIDAAQKKAIRATTNTLKSVTKDATLTASESQKIWATAATRATDGIGNASEKQASIVKAGVKDSLGAFSELENYLNKNDYLGQISGEDKEFKVFNKVFSEYGSMAGRVVDIHDDLQETVVGLNRSFATLAKENIYNALGAMRAFAEVNNLNDRELKTLITSDKALQNELVKHAKAIGYVVEGQDGLVDTSKLLDIAFGRNGYKARLLTLEYEKFEKQVDAVVGSFGTIKDAMDENTKTAEDNTKTFNFSGFLKSVKKQGTAALEYANNMQKLRKTLGTENSALFADLVSQGQSAAGLVQSLLDGSEEKMKEYIKTAKKRAQDLETSKRIMMAFSDFRVLYKALENKNVSRETKRLAEMMQNNGDSVVSISAALGITDEQMIAASKQIRSGVADATTDMEVSASWNKESLGQLKKQFEGEMGNYKLTVSELNADGGLAGNGSKLVGRLGPKGYATGGLVFGQGGPRQDRIPAYLSHGEYVINAAATSRNLEILKAINSGKSVMGGNMNITVNAAPGMNERDVANLVATRLTYELQKGFTS
jgi:transposase-like protein